MCVLSLRSNIFRKYWEILKRNYKDNTHTEEDFKIYYSILKEYSEKDVIEAIKNVLKKKKFFPQINEICEFLPESQSDVVPAWINKKNEVVEISSEEAKELEDLLNEMSIEDER